MDSYQNNFLQKPPREYNCLPLYVSLFVGILAYIALLITAQPPSLASNTAPYTIEQRPGGGGNICQSMPNCSACIRRSPSCTWCMQEVFQPNAPNTPRCDYERNLISRNCSQSQIVNPQSEIRILRNESLSIVGSATSGVQRVVQLQPQSVSLKLRLKQSYIFTVRYRQAEDYPVDLYYLMDLSNSMKDDKDQLASLGRKLGSEMRALTKKFTIGYGSFVDKTVAPFVNTVPKKLLEPCAGCAAVYGYKHHMSLSQDADKFSDEVAKAPISGNLDTPEGGFDAIMQAIVCNQIIGWRSDARKLLVFSTDSSFHYAGDGKLGGIVTPNDGKCHMARDAGPGNIYRYTQSEKLDYPSVSQVSEAVKNHSINLIFAVTRDQVKIYEQLSELIEGSTAAELAEDSSNIIELIKREYEKITSTIVLRDTARRDIFHVDYFSNCLEAGAAGADGVAKRTNRCTGIKLNDMVSWTVNVTAHSCPPDPRDRRQRFQISPVGLQEMIDVDVEIICDCDCAKISDPVKDRTICNSNGRYVCGICECDPFHLGAFCQCQKNESITDETLFERCRAPNGLICSGRGECVCGQCQCYARENPAEEVYGPFCECDNFTCDRFQGKICGGIGKCVCKECECPPGYTGKACECKMSNEDCYFNGEICNGHGECVCGRCMCEQGYWGPRCEMCAECRQNNCNKLRDCVECYAFQSGPLAPRAECDKCPFIPIVVDKVVEETPDEHICQFKTDDGCFFKFKYALNYTNPNNSFVVHVERDLVCPEPVNLLAVLLGIIAGIIGLGLVLLLIWKLLTYLHDRREYARFEEERLKAKWNTSGNPIFRQATNTYKNPMYAGNTGGVVKGSVVRSEPLLVQRQPLLVQSDTVIRSRPPPPGGLRR